tara:strand:- start:508 stop:660 length:153 start_codon:yes stop_codon:yes gene_type:complete
MENKNYSKQKNLSCQIPRRKQAIEALLSLAWKKPRKARAKWIITELKSIL